MPKKKSVPAPSPAEQIDVYLSQRYTLLGEPRDQENDAWIGRNLFLAAANTWERYPEYWWKIIIAEKESTIDPIGARHAIERLHSRAIAIIGKYASAYSIDPAPIQVSGEICIEVFRIRKSPATIPKLDMADLFWPDCLSHIDANLGETEEATVRLATSQLKRLREVVKDTERFVHLGGGRKARVIKPAGILMKTLAMSDTEQLPAIPKMSDNQKAVFELLNALPSDKAMNGKEIISKLRKEKATEIGQGALTSRIIPFLKKHYGVKNQAGAGYYVEKNA